MLQSGVRFRAYPTAELAGTIAQWVGCQRVIYNAKVEEDRLFASMRRGLIAAGHTEVLTPLDRKYSQFKSDELTPWLSSVPSQVLRNGCDRWFDAKQRQLKGLARAPSRRNRANFNSVLVSSELFRFVERTDKAGKTTTTLQLGTLANPVGELTFTAHRPYGPPKQLTLRRKAQQWFVSFSYEHSVPDAAVAREPHELAYELDLLSDELLNAAVLGLDRNVCDNSIATSDGRFYGLSPVQQTRIERKAHGTRVYARRMARQVKGSNNRAKTRGRLAAKQRYGGDVRLDFSHQTSHSLTAQPLASGRPVALIGFEALKVKNMTARPKARPAKTEAADGSVRWLRNGAAQKAGLNKAILGACWGLIANQVRYKAARRNTLVVDVPAAYSSQECSRCGHTHPDNRAQRVFVCQRCGFSEHADTNASCNIAARAVRLVRGGTLQVPKVKKRVARPKRQAKSQEPNDLRTPGPEGSAVPVESAQDTRRSAKTARVQRSAKQESPSANSDAPTTAPSGV